jgi:hypothetical protein
MQVKTLDFNKIKDYNNFIKIKKQIITNQSKGGRSTVALTALPDWLTDLDEEDLAFIRKFVLSSGSLKEMAQLYGVTYPTVRLRLDRLIQRIRLRETAAADPYIALVKRLALDDRLDFDTAKLLISEYKKNKKEDN